MLTYDNVSKYWNKIFKENSNIKKTNTTNNNDLDKALGWLCTNTDTILDFGCGNGNLLFICSLIGSKNHIGIDISKEAINVANEYKNQFPNGNFRFYNGGIHSLKSIEPNSIDAFIFSNILDNLLPLDSLKVIKETKRIIKSKGKILIKLNSYLTKYQINKYKIKVIKDNLLDDGLYLWNQTNEEWIVIFNRYFQVKEYHDIFFPKHNQFNRLFLLTN